MPLLHGETVSQQIRDYERIDQIHQEVVAAGAGSERMGLRVGGGKPGARGWGGGAAEEELALPIAEADDESTKFDAVTGRKSGAAVLLQEQDDASPSAEVLRSLPPLSQKRTPKQQALPTTFANLSQLTSLEHSIKTTNVPDPPPPSINPFCSEPADSKEEEQFLRQKISKRILAQIESQISKDKISILE